MGDTTGGQPGYSVIAEEVIRDVAAQRNWSAATIPKVRQIVSLPEVGHQFVGIGHSAATLGSNIMTAPNVDADELKLPNYTPLFSDEDILRIRRKDHP